jgi:hypothetical protein
MATNIKTYAFTAAVGACFVGSIAALLPTKQRNIMYDESPQETINEAPIIPTINNKVSFPREETTRSTYIPSKNNGMEFPSEKKCREIIEEYFQAPFPKESKFCKNPMTKSWLELDGYNPELKIAFEYQGEQHYDENHRFWKTKKEYRDQKFRDNVKRLVCKRRGIDLIVIPCSAKKRGGIEKVLKEYLQEKYQQKRLSSHEAITIS